MRYATSAMLATLLVPLLVLSSSVAGASAPAALILPASNVPAAFPVVSDARIAYVVPDPLIRPRKASESWAVFRDHIFVAGLRTLHGGLVMEKPREVLAGPLGNVIELDSIAGGWMVYARYGFLDPASQWVLIARNLATGLQLVLDTPELEGMPSLVAQAASDGRTVIWQSWTLAHGQPMSVIRTYDLATRQHKLLAAGGSTTTWSYDWPDISGTTAVFEKERLGGSPRNCQVLAANLLSGRIRALTPPTATNSEPSVSGDLVAWKQGSRFSGANRIGLYNMRTGTLRTLVAAGVERPRAVAGRYVVYPVNAPHSNARDFVQLFDSHSGTTETLSAHSGNVVLAGEDAVGYWIGGAGEANSPQHIGVAILAR